MYKFYIIYNLFCVKLFFAYILKKINFLFGHGFVHKEESGSKSQEDQDIVIHIFFR